MTENSVSSVEIKAVDEGENSAAPVPNAEKWSHEPIVAFVKCATCKKGKTTYQNFGFGIIGTAKRQAKINNRYIDEIIVEKFL